jgi:hypothetical protein
LSSTEHHYTEANLPFEHLKGADRAMLRALRICRALDAHLVLVTRRVCGGTDSPYYGYGRGGYKRRRCWGSDGEEEEEEEYEGTGHHTMGEVRSEVLVSLCDVEWLVVHLVKIAGVLIHSRCCTP